MRRIQFHRIAIAITFGVIVNVLVAWWCHRLDWPMNREVLLGPGPPAWPTQVPPQWPSDPRIESGIGTRTSDRWFYWFVDSKVRTQYLVEVYRSGWPWVALARFRASSGPPGSLTPVPLDAIHDGVKIPDQWRVGLWLERPILPLMPVWHGFALNSLFYGVCFLGTMAGISAIKRRRRAERGLCGECGYPRTGGEICPECGVAVRVAAKLPAVAAEPIESTPV